MRVAIILLAVIVAAPGHAASLREILDQVWERSPKARALEARQGEVAARRRVAASLLPEPPAAGVSFLTDQATDDEGRREWEAELELPLWRLGERAARQGLAEREQGGLEAERQALRLELAGELREAVWTVALAEAELRVAEWRLDSARDLEQDVARRVRAGELARTELLLAQDDTLAAQTFLLEKETELAQARKAYFVLTGEERLPEPREEPLASEVPEHAALESPRRAAAVAEARLRVAGKAAPERPQLIFNFKRERDTREEPFDNSVGVRLRLPFGTSTYQRPEIAAAHTELAEADTAYARAQDRVESEIKVARVAYELASARLAAVREKQRVAAEHFALQQRSFDLGQIDLFNLLRVKAIAVAAEIEAAQQEIIVARDRARLNQALGILP